MAAGSRAVQVVALAGGVARPPDCLAGSRPGGEHDGNGGRRSCRLCRERDEGTIKPAQRPAVAGGGLVPAPLQAAGLNAAMANRLFNLVVSNVRGVEHPLYLLGARHVVSYPLMSLAEGSGMSIAVVTAGGVMGVGITCDPNLVPHPERLAEGMSEAFDELARSSKASSSCPDEAAGKRRSRSERKATPRRLHRR